MGPQRPRGHRLQPPVSPVPATCLGWEPSKSNARCASVLRCTTTLRLPGSEALWSREKWRRGESLHFTAHLTAPQSAAVPRVGARGCCVKRGGEEGQHEHGTLSDKSLAGIQQNLTALNNHPLYRQIFPNIFGLTHFVVHYPEGGRREMRSWSAMCLSSPSGSLPTPWRAAVGRITNEEISRELQICIHTDRLWSSGDNLDIGPDYTSRFLKIEVLLVLLFLLGNHEIVAQGRQIPPHHETTSNVPAP